MANEIHSGLTHRIEHLVAPNMQRDKIDIQLPRHNNPLNRSVAVRGEA
ncbi:hypothetical protein LRC484719_45430 [Mycobacterium riyadhense]